MSNIMSKTIRGTWTLRMSSLANEVEVGHRESPWLRDENNRFPH